MVAEVIANDLKAKVIKSDLADWFRVLPFKGTPLQKTKHTKKKFSGSLNLLRDLRHTNTNQ